MVFLSAMFSLAAYPLHLAWSLPPHSQDGHGQPGPASHGQTNLLDTRSGQLLLRTKLQRQKLHHKLTVPMYCTSGVSLQQSGFHHVSSLASLALQDCHRKDFDLWNKVHVKK